MQGFLRSIFILTFLIVLFVVAKAEALEPQLLWKKEFKYKIESVGFAADSGEVIVGLDKKEVILLDKDGQERFHWGPRVDRRVGGVRISKDGNYLSFYSGYTWQYAEKKKMAEWEDDRVHFYNAKTKKEIWNIKTAEGTPYMAPDGKSLIVNWENGDFELYDFKGQKIYRGTPGFYFAFSPDSNYFTVTGEPEPLVLFKKDGTKIWERGRHPSMVASISEGASYISTYPYHLGLNLSPDSLNTHLGIVYDRNGNKVLEGLGVVSGNGSRIAMYSVDKITILNLPDETVFKEIPVQIELPKISNPFFARFSYDGRYLIIKKESNLLVFDLVENVRKDIFVPGMGVSQDMEISNNGKYLIIRPGETTYKKTILYYQLY